MSTIRRQPYWYRGTQQEWNAMSEADRQAAIDKHQRERDAERKTDPNTMVSLIMNAVEHGNWTEVYLWSQELAGYARTRARTEFDIVFGDKP